MFSLILALYLSRIGAEFLFPTTPIIGILGGLTIGGAGGLWLKKRKQISGWSALPLAFYVLFPFQSPQLALGCGLMTVLVWGTVMLKYGGWGVDACIFIITLGLYTLSLAPGIQPADAGEFQLVIAAWGVAHPPGYPLYTLLGGLFAHLLPLGDLPTRVNLFSALTAALTLAVLSRAVRQETGSGMAGIAAAGILATAASFWATANQASIRPMTALFAVLMLEAVLAYRRAVRNNNRRYMRRALVRFGLAAGFGVTHHASLFFPGAVLALAILAARPALLRQFRLWGQALLAALMGALPWLYLLQRGAAGALLAPDNLTTWDGFWQHVLARGFAGDMFYYRTVPAVLDRLQLIGRVLSFQWADLVLVLAGLALLLMLWRDRWLLLVLGGAFALHAFVAATYRAPQTVEYMIPAYVYLAAGGGWIAGEMRRLDGRCLYPLLAALVGVAIMWSGWPDWISSRIYQFRDPTSATAYALLRSAPPDSTILANWHQVTPLWTIQTVDHLREDVTVRYVAPAGAEPILDTWARLVSTESTGSPLVTCAYYPEVFRYTGRTFSALESCWMAGHENIPAGAAAAASFEGGTAVYTNAQMVEAFAGEQVDLSLGWRIPEAVTFGELTTFVHLVDEEGRVLAQNDQPMIAADLQAPGMVRQHYPLMLPRTLPAGRYRLMAGAYYQTSDGPLSLLDDHGEARTAIGQITIHASRIPPVTGHELYTPFDASLILLGYDYDLSVPGRARLYLHWQITMDNPGTILALNISNAAEQPLAAADIPLGERGFLTTAHDLPDVATVDGLRITIAREDGELLLPRAAWGLPLSPAASIPGPSAGERYIMIGEAAITSYDVYPAERPGEETIVALTMRSLSTLTQDISFQLASGEVRTNSTPVGGTIPTLKWGWSAMIMDRLRLQWPESSDAQPDAPLTLTLYDAFTSQPWPVFDPILGQNGPFLPLSQ